MPSPSCWDLTDAPASSLSLLHPDLVPETSSPQCHSWTSSIGARWGFGRNTESPASPFQWSQNLSFKSMRVMFLSLQSTSRRGRRHCVRRGPRPTRHSMAVCKRARHPPQTQAMHGFFPLPPRDGQCRELLRSGLKLPAFQSCPSSLVCNSGRLPSLSASLGMVTMLPNRIEVI